MPKFSGTELKIYNLLKQGAKNKQIAEEVGWALPAVKTAVHRVIARSGFKSRKELKEKGV